LNRTREGVVFCIAEYAGEICLTDSGRVTLIIDTGSMYECTADGLRELRVPVFPSPARVDSLETVTENVLLSPVTAVSIDFGKEITPITAVLSRNEAVKE